MSRYLSLAEGGGEGGGLYSEKVRATVLRQADKQAGTASVSESGSGTSGTPDTGLPARLPKTPAADVLLECGIYATSRAKREELGTELEWRGYTADDLRPILYGVLELASSPRIGIGECLNLLRDKTRMDESVEDHRRIVAAKAATTYPGGFIMEQNKRRLAELNAEWEKLEKQKAAGGEDQ